MILGEAQAGAGITGCRSPLAEQGVPRESVPGDRRATCISVVNLGTVGWTQEVRPAPEAVSLWDTLSKEGPGVQAVA